ncbi:MAG: vWA domain-containing protein [Myxococcota bacterium]
MIAWMLLACQSGDFPAPILGTAYRIEDDVPESDGQVRIDVLANRKQCVNAEISDLDHCLPYADRGTGSVRLAFQLLDPRRSVQLHRAVREDQLIVTHDEAVQQTYQLFPHDPVSPSQLFVVVIDGSASMFASGGARIQAVYDALLRPSIIDAFYPPGTSGTGVVLLRFTETTTGIDGGSPKVLTQRSEYERLIREHLLTPSRGYTHLYDAVQYSLVDLMRVPAVSEFVQQRTAEPTVVVLTDGFNNEGPGERCRDNVARLESTVRLIRTVRSETSAFLQPTVYTIGLGRPYRRGNKPPGVQRPVTVEELCGENGNARIDPALEQYGIDHLSLQWIAEAGGGRSVVQDDSRDLPRVLGEAVPQRYRWYELWVQAPDPFYHRTRFELGLRIDQTSTTIGVLPHPWLDGPRGRNQAESAWREPAPVRHIFTVLVPALAILLLARYLGPAWFAARRLLFRGRPRRR